VLKVTGAAGEFTYDFAVVQVMDKDDPENVPPTIHASYAPTFGIDADEPVTFKVRTFRTRAGEETWDFGDGSSEVTVRSDGNADPKSAIGYAETVHRFARPGHYLISVQRRGHTGASATAHLHVTVGE
jgi:hypothetical protein